MLCLPTASVSVIREISIPYAGEKSSRKESKIPVEVKLLLKLSSHLHYLGKETENRIGKMMKVKP